MKHFTIVGTYLVERVFVVDAESEDAALDDPAAWEEVEEITQERLSVEVTEEAEGEVRP